MNTNVNYEFRRKEQGAHAVPAPMRNPFALVLLWAAKTDPNLVAVCSRWTIATQQAFGLFVSLQPSWRLAQRSTRSQL